MSETEQPGNLGDNLKFMLAEAGAELEEQPKKEIPHPEHDARGYVNAVVMPYLTPGLEALLHVAKERGKLPKLGGDSKNDTPTRSRSGEHLGTDEEDEMADPDDDAKFDPLRWLSDYLRQYVDKPGKYKELFNQRLADSQREQMAQASNT
mmetsp:Transcript_22152/g.55866  ORF Transcript_22152/g.55866 Transcript_22152/m.55866 type:complete len:150 (-) Transcript_22152:175-624(-)|eukprot:CAMPEP_0178998910 /NCGR_PEP_ID=MMETSP0795-20121207/9762_1 /TAXON_ID=88552 /ORGANISM="Amoebophrya sp., Strain Ameob2" /LENGTH=149 /DNA_ID=CAMNT_0020691615 /DNA_START=434 /DNA_END=883 /DNA_ORIENTATION=+